MKYIVYSKLYVWISDEVEAESSEEAIEIENEKFFAMDDEEARHFIEENMADSEWEIYDYE